MGSSGYTLRNIRAGSIHGNNVFRNVVSVLGASDVQIESITGDSVGLYHFDIEPDSYYTPVTGVWVGYIRGRYVGIIGSASSVYVDGVELGMVDLDASYTGNSTPNYTALTLSHALQVRNCKSLQIGKFKANGFDGQAIKHVYNVGELAIQNVRIGQAEISDCCKTEATYLTYVLGNASAMRLRIDQFVPTITRSGVSAIRNCTGAIIGQVDTSLATGTRLLHVTDDGRLGPVYASGGTGILAVSCTRTVSPAATSQST